MKEELLKRLNSDEELLYYGVSNTSKTSLQLGRFVVLFLILAIFGFIFYISIERVGFQIILFFLVLFFMIGLAIYGLVFNLSLKHKNDGNECFVTNKRVCLYTKEVGFRFMDISKIDALQICREKDNYGDITFGFISNNITEKMKTMMVFAGIESPRKVVEIVMNIKPSIQLIEDSITIMGNRL